MDKEPRKRGKEHEVWRESGPIASSLRLSLLLYPCFAAIAVNISDRQSACVLVDRWMVYYNTQRSHGGFVNKGLPPMALWQLYEKTPGDYLQKLIKLGLLKLDQEWSVRLMGVELAVPTQAGGSGLLRRTRRRSRGPRGSLRTRPREGSEGPLRSRPPGAAGYWGHSTFKTWPQRHAGQAGLSRSSRRGVVGGSPPLHPRRWGKWRLASGPPASPQDCRGGSLGPVAGWRRDDFLVTPQPRVEAGSGLKQGRAGGTPAMAGDSKGLAAPAPFATSRTDRKVGCPRPEGRRVLRPLTFPLMAGMPKTHAGDCNPCSQTTAKLPRAGFTRGGPTHYGWHATPQGADCVPNRRRNPPADAGRSPDAV